MKMMQHACDVNSENSNRKEKRGIGNISQKNDANMRTSFFSYQTKKTKLKYSSKAQGRKRENNATHR